MVAFSRTVLATAAVYLASSVVADDGWQTSAFSTCMKQKCPDYPHSLCTSDVFFSCHPMKTKGGPKEKRSGDLETRDFASIVTPLINSAQADCVSDQLPKNFIPATDFGNEAAEACQIIKNDLLTKGVGYFNKNITNAVTKSADELHGGKAVMLSIALGIYPPAQRAFIALQNADTAIEQACEAAVKALSTKGGPDGCTTDLGWYNAGKARHETTTGALGGWLEIADQVNNVMSIGAQFLPPSAQIVSSNDPNGSS